MIRLLNPKGITLVELLAIITLLSLISMLAMSIFLSGQKTYTRTVAETADVDELRYSLKVIGQDLRSASVIRYSNKKVILSIGGKTVTYEADDQGFRNTNGNISANVTAMDVSKNGKVIVVKLTSKNTSRSSETHYTLRQGVNWIAPTP